MNTENKIFIDDPAKRMHGVKEHEFTDDTHIRFEFGGKKIVIHLAPGGCLSIREVGDSGEISLYPSSRNQVFIK